MATESTDPLTTLNVLGFPSLPQSYPTGGGLRVHETRNGGLGEDKNTWWAGVGFPWILWVDLGRSCVAIRDLDPPAVATLRLTRPWLIRGGAEGQRCPFNHLPRNSRKNH